MSTKQQELANKIYDLLLNTSNWNEKVAELKWVVNLTLIDAALTVIQIWLEENREIQSLRDYLEYIEVEIKDYI